MTPVSILITIVAYFIILFTVSYIAGRKADNEGFFVGNRKSAWYVVAFAMIGTAIPLAVTGGFHVDGFMDTMDAFHSYQPREKKLEILKDSHIGAFSVICLVLYELIYIGAYSEIDAVRQAGIVAAGFFLSRCLSGIAAMTFPGAKKEGLLYMFTSKAHERAVKTALFLQTAAVAVLMLYLDGVTGVAVLVGAGLIIRNVKRNLEVLPGIPKDIL